MVSGVNDIDDGRRIGEVAPPIGSARELRRMVERILEIPRTEYLIGHLDPKLEI